MSENYEDRLKERIAKQGSTGLPEGETGARNLFDRLAEEAYAKLHAHAVWKHKHALAGGFGPAAQADAQEKEALGTAPVDSSVVSDVQTAVSDAEAVVADVQAGDDKAAADAVVQDVAQVAEDVAPADTAEVEAVVPAAEAVAEQEAPAIIADVEHEAKAAEQAVEAEVEKL